MKSKSNYLFILAAACLILPTFNSSCIKKDPETRISQVLLVPLSPNTGAVDFSINGTLHATTVGYSSTAGTIRYSLPYYTVESQSSSIIAYNATGTTNTIASVTKDLEEDKAYSTFLIGTAPQVQAVLVNDDLTDPVPGKVKIRFFHFSPNAPAMDVSIMGTTTKLFTGRSFNDQSNNTAHEKFIEIDAGNYTFVFTDASTGATIYTTSAQNLLPERIYTLAARGLIGGPTGQAIGAWVYPNKP